MNTFEQTKWAIARKKGSIRYIIEYTALMLIIVAGVNIITAGVGVAIESSGWNTFVRDVQTIKWLRVLGLTVFLGSAYSWYSKERSYKNQPSK